MRIADPRLFDRRLVVQHLSRGTQLDTPEAVVRRLGAVQSQDYIGAKWSLAQRVTNPTDAGIDSAFSEGRFLRTHVLRPTWHFVAPEDLRWMLALTSPHVLRLASYQFRKFELDPATLGRCCKYIERALLERPNLTREELGARLAANGIAGGDGRHTHVMLHAELVGLVCSGELRGKRQTYALMDTRTPASKPLARVDAVVELCRRFFAGHAPATLGHFAWWSGLTVGESRVGLEGVRGELVAEAIDGVEWLSAEVTAPPRRTATAYLLPEYDEALVGVKDMRVPDTAPRRPTRPLAFAFDRPIIIDGKRAGGWKRISEPRQVTMEVGWLARPDPSHRRALNKVVAQYEQFLGIPVSLTVAKKIPVPNAPSRV